MSDTNGSMRLSRRKLLTATGAAGAAAVAGCSQGVTGAASTQEDDSGSLKTGGSSTVYPIVNKAASYWNSNRPATDQEYWGPSQYGIETDKRFADYWAGLYGLDSEDGSTPPFEVSVALSHSGTGLEKVKNQQLDIGNASASVSAEYPDKSEEELANFTDHVVGVDAQPIVVSKEVYDAGVTKLTAEQVRGIYTGEITQWSEIPSYDGPDHEIQAIGRAEGSGTDTAFRSNMLGGPNASMDGVDARKGQNQQVKTLVSNSNNAVAYLALAFTDPDSQVPPIALEMDGTVYKYGENLDAKGYPLSRDLHCYTWKGTSKKEAAFLRAILTEFGQQNFVQPENYVALSEERLKNQREKLPEIQE